MNHDFAIGSSSGSPRRNFNSASSTCHFLGSPISWRPGSFGGRFPQGSLSGQLFSSLDQQPTNAYSTEELMNAFNVFDREGELCRDYTCCGIHLQDLHALLEHFEEVHVLVLDPNNVGTVQLQVPFNPQPGNVLQQSHMQNQHQSLQHHHHQQHHSSFDAADDMELELDLDNFTLPLQSPLSHSPPSSRAANFSPHSYSYYSPYRSTQASPYTSQDPSPASSSISINSLQSESYQISARMGQSGVPASDPSPVLANPEEASSSSTRFAANYSSYTSRARPNDAPLPTTTTASLLLSKPFKCPRPNCNKSYKQANGLKYHMTHGSCNFAPSKDLEHVKDLLEMKRREKEAAGGGSNLHRSSSLGFKPRGEPLIHPAYGDLGDITESELREVEREAEKRLRPFACGIGDCQRRYKNMNGLRYHYQHSGDHGALGLAMLAQGTHECLGNHNKDKDKSKTYSHLVGDERGRRRRGSVPNPGAGVHHNTSYQMLRRAASRGSASGSRAGSASGSRAGSISASPVRSIPASPVQSISASPTGSNGYFTPNSLPSYQLSGHMGQSGASAGVYPPYAEPGIPAPFPANPEEALKSNAELREMEREAEKRFRPFACGIGDCQRRYKNINGLRYHYTHSGDHGALGLAMLAQGTHECLSNLNHGQDKDKSKSLAHHVGEEVGRRRRGSSPNHGAGVHRTTSYQMLRNTASGTTVPASRPRSISRDNPSYNNSSPIDGLDDSPPLGAAVQYMGLEFPPPMPYDSSIHGLGESPQQQTLQISPLSAQQQLNDMSIEDQQKIRVQESQTYLTDLPAQPVRGEHQHQQDGNYGIQAQQAYTQRTISTLKGQAQEDMRQGEMDTSRSAEVKDTDELEWSQAESQVSVDEKHQRDTTIGWLKALFRDKDRYRLLLSLKGHPAQTFVNFLQELLDSADVQSGFRKEMIVTLQKLANNAEVYPSSYQVEEEIVPDQTCFMGGGGFGEIFKCQRGGQAVCVKVIRLTAISQGPRFMKQFMKEAILWAQLSHRNIVPFQGFFYYSNKPCLLSPWMVNGQVNEYLKDNPSLNRYLLVKDMTEGLHYLHSWDIVHGDLKGANVVVDDLGRARLTDFGISSVFDAALPHWSSLSTVASKGGSPRWQAPELFESNNDQDVYNTIMSDVYAWGCTCYEIFAGKLPFYEILKEFTVMLQVTRDGLRPSRPPAGDPAWLVWGLQEQFWDLMERCWAKDPKERPPVHDLLTAPLLTEAQDIRPSCAWPENATQYRAIKGASGTTSSLTIHALERILSGYDLNP